MKKRLYKAKLIGAIIGLLELFGVVFLGLAYYFDFFGADALIVVAS